MSLATNTSVARKERERQVLSEYSVGADTRHSGRHQLSLCICDNCGLRFVAYDYLSGLCEECGESIDTTDLNIKGRLLA